MSSFPNGMIEPGNSRFLWNPEQNRRDFLEGVRAAELKRQKREKALEDENRHLREMLFKMQNRPSSER